MPEPLISVDTEIKPLETQLAYEKQLLQACREDKSPRIHLWQAQQTLVASKTEARLPRFQQAQAQMAAQGWPVIVRDTGGTAVPQSPGTLNLTMIYATQDIDIDASYIRLCQPIIEALAGLDVTARATAVAGSFCDGKYNLAVNDQGTSKKIVGTSQKWSVDKIVLGHAVILSSIDTDEATAAINQFYALAGSQAVKSADVVTSIQQYMGHSDNITIRLRQALVEACQSITLL